MTQKSTESPIEEIHRIRRDISDRFAGDIAAIAEDAAKRQAESNRPVWQPNTTNQAMHPSGESGDLPVNKPSPAAG